MAKGDVILRRKVRRSYAVSTISIALVLFLLGTVGYIMASVWSVASVMRESVTMIVELNDDLSSQQREAVAASLEASDMVLDVRFVSKEEKLADEEFRRSFAIDIESILGTNPLPDSFDVTLSATASDSEALKQFVEESSSIEGVSHVSYPELLLSKMHSVLDTMQIILLLFGGAMLVISLILLGNTIRLAIFSRREVINTMKLVGATKWFIMRPFVGKSALQGLFAGLGATLLFVLSLYGLDRGLPELGVLGQLELIGAISLVMILLGIVVATLFTVFTVNKFVNMQSNKIHLY